MPVEPSVFLCYGNPNKAIAHSIAKELWNEKIECYNYLAKPVEDRLGHEVEYLAYIASTKIFVAIVSEAGFFRTPVIDEIFHAQLITSLDESFKRIYIVTSAMKERLTNFRSDLKPDLVIDLDMINEPSEIAQKIIGVMSPELLTRCQKAWEINKNLYPDAWMDLDRQYNSPKENPITITPEDLLSSIAPDSYQLELYLKDDLEQISDS